MGSVLQGVSIDDLFTRRVLASAQCLALYGLPSDLIQEIIMRIERIHKRRIITDLLGYGWRRIKHDKLGWWEQKEKWRRSICLLDEEEIDRIKLPCMLYACESLRREGSATCLVCKQLSWYLYSHYGPVICGYNCRTAYEYRR